VTPTAKPSLRRRGLRLEYATLGWNVVGVPVLAVAAVRAGSPAAAGFAVDSLIEIAASLVVVWQLTGAAPTTREQRGERLIGAAFTALTAYLLLQAAYTLLAGSRPRPSALGIGWSAATVAVMLALAAGKLATGKALGNPVLRAEGRVTLLDAYLAVAVLLGLAVNAARGWWWADPLAGLVVAGYAAREAHHSLTGGQAGAAT